MRQYHNCNFYLTSEKYMGVGAWGAGFKKFFNGITETMERTDPLFLRLFNMKHLIIN